MGFFNKIFGGKKDQDDQEKSREETPSKEIKTEKPREQSSKKPAVKEDKPTPVVEKAKEQKRETKPAASVSGEMPARRDSAVSGEIPARRDSAVSGQMAVSSKVEAEEDRSETVENKPLTFETLNEQPAAKQEPAKEKPVVKEEPVVKNAEPVKEDPIITEEELDEEPEEAEVVPATKSHPDFDDDSLFGGAKPTVHKPEAASKNLSNTIACSTCSRKLPIPFVGYNAKITCPFCLTVNEYKA